MTDKQVIIDGVDVSECSNNEGKLCSMSREAYCYCSDKPNCIYKQLKRKEQECEQEKTLKEMYFTYYKAKHSDVKGEFFKLKAENWELKRELIQYEKDFKDLNYCAIKLKQTLTEIKEIVKPHQRNIDKICGHCRRYDTCYACCIDDINCYQYKKPTTSACDKYCELKEFEINNMANQVLQKISEVENA